MAAALVGLMGPVSLAVLVGCLRATGYLLGFIAALLVLLVLKQAWGGEGVVAGLFAAAPAFALLGWGCGWFARRVQGTGNPR